MSQMILKIKSLNTNNRNAINVIDNNDIQSRLFKSMLAGLGFLALTYVFILGSMILNIVERRNLDVEARALSSEVSNLELTYLNLSGEIDLALSDAMGFSETKPSFATRRPVSVIKVANNEI